MQPTGHTKPSITVVHLIWLPFGIDLFKKFISSYKNFNAGCDHHLVLLFNGLQHKSEAHDYESFAADEKIIFTSYYKNGGQDIDAYFWIAAQLQDEYLLFLNSYAQILQGDWLKKYIQVMASAEKVGIVGATGAFTSPYNKLLKENSWKWEQTKTFYHHYRKYKLLLKTIFLYSFYFKKFPNPHIRSNAFMIRKNVFLSLTKKVLRKKMDAYLFECGKKSMTNQLLKMNLEALVIDKYGRTYQLNQWAASNTFWIKNQENLLVSDNQTEIYNQGDDAYQKHLSNLAWGTI